MARKKRIGGRTGKTQEGSMSSYWKQIFKDHPELLRGRKNQPLFDLWKADNPGKNEVPPSVKNSLNSVKAQLRGKKGKGTRKRRTSTEDASNGTAKTRATRSPRGSSNLVSLEYQIDDCLIAARTLENDALKKVIDLLRSARNEIVVMLHT